jgi:hypothetical protein
VGEGRKTMAVLWDRFQSGGSGCSAAKALTGLEPNSEIQVDFEKNPERTSLGILY